MLKDVINVNPREHIPKREKTKKVNMNALIPFTRKIYKYVVEVYKGGSKFRNGDTLLVRMGSCLENGKTAFVDFLNPGEVGFGSTEFIVIREKPGVTNKLFLYYFVRSKSFRDLAIKSITGTSRQRVDTPKILNHEFYLPRLLEQKAIAEVLSSLDDKIDLLYRQNKTLESMAQTLFRQWFIEEKDERWERKPLDEIADYLNGLACQKYPPANKTDKLPVLKIRELQSGFTKSSDWATSNVKKKYIIEIGDVIFSWSGSLIIKIWNGEKCVLNQHLFKITSEHYPKWFFYFWTKHYLQKFIAIANSKATTMGHIKRCDLSSSAVSIPPNTDLRKMTDKIAPLFEKIPVNYKKIQTLETLRDNLLPKLMSGEMRTG